jgi:triosephosphate isomerase
MKRNKVIAGNWKMYKTNDEALTMVNALKIKVTGTQKTTMIVCPPFTALSAVAAALKDSAIAVGAQNMHWEKQGAFTGEISAGMILNIGAAYVILGHSERRQYFGETDATINKKLMSALDAGLLPIVCVGETLGQREQGVTNKIVGDQLAGSLAGMSADVMAGIILAYEPVWAIGTGKTATPDQAQEVHAFIRSFLGKAYGEATAEKVIIQYGGSVKPGNAHDLLTQKDVDGALVGGACLEADSFSAIIEVAENIAG